MKGIKPSARMFHHAKQMLLNEFENVEIEFAHKDVFGFNSNGDSCEIEIKCSDYDFYKEFNKPAKKFKHDNYKKNPVICPTRFYFFVPKSFVDRALKRMHSHSWYSKYGLIAYDFASDNFSLIQKSDRLSDQPFLGEVLQMPFRDFKHRNIYIK